MPNPLDKPMTDRPAEALALRLQYCRKMLYAHGFLTEAQNKNVRAKLPEEVKK